MIKIITLILLIVFAVYVLNCRIVFAADEKSVIISELFWSGSFVSTADEFLELKNNSSVNIDMSGWQLTKVGADGKEELMLEISSGIIPAGGYFLISNSSQNHSFANGESIVNIKPDVIDSDVSLSNDRLQIKLYDGSFDDGRLPVDVAGNGLSPLAGDNSLKASMERANPFNDGENITSWLTANSRLNLDIGREEFATPQNSGKPELENLSSNVGEYYLGRDTGPIAFYANVDDQDGIPDIERVYLEFSIEGKLVQVEMHDDGLDGDQIPDDSIFTCNLNLKDYTEFYAGEKIFNAYAVDSKNLVDGSQNNIYFYELSDNIVVNEILPKPEDDSQAEFIELYNKGENDVDIFGWQIDDASDSGSQPYRIDQNTIIPGKGYLTFFKSITKIALNDSGDVARLIDPTGKEISTTTYYGSAKKGCSFNRLEDSWFWSTIITPGYKNEINIPPEKSSKVAVNLEKIIETRKLPKGTQVTFVGTVINTPGNFSFQYFYVEDDSAGIQVYCYKKDFPSINIGDKIRVCGNLTFSKSTGYRIKISNQANIEVIERNVVVIPETIKTGNIGSDEEGKLVRVRGKVIKSSGSTFYLDDGSGIIKVVVKKSTGINKPKISKNMIIEIIGIVVPYKDTYQIAPRFNSDIKIISGGTLSKKSKSVMKKIISPAMARNSADNNIPVKENRAKIISSSQFFNKMHLIKILEIIIIVSSVLLFILYWEKYAKGEKINHA